MKSLKRVVGSAMFQIQCQVPGPRSEITQGRKTARETWRKISRELKGQNTMHSHQGGGQCQVFTSPSYSLSLNEAGYQFPGWQLPISKTTRDESSSFLRAARASGSKRLPLVYLTNAEFIIKKVMKISILITEKNVTVDFRFLYLTVIHVLFSVYTQP